MLKVREGSSVLVSVNAACINASLIKLALAVRLTRKARWLALVPACFRVHAAEM